MQAYSNPKRASDPHALPDVEVFYEGLAPRWNSPLDCHVCAAEAYDRNNNQTPHGEHVGWYWVSSFPGCLWDGEPSGPFGSEAEALADAQSGCEDDE